MADIELGHLRDLRDGQNIVVIEAVAAVNLESETLRKLRSFENCLQLLLALDA